MTEPRPFDPAQVPFPLEPRQGPDSPNPPEGPDRGALLPPRAMLRRPLRLSVAPPG